MTIRKNSNANANLMRPVKPSVDGKRLSKLQDDAS
jgi:hypothetical protein